MLNEFSRTELILGCDAINKLKKSKVAVFGIGGVGGFVCEALVRSGVGALDFIDNDTVSVTNINRQIIAMHSTIGMYKTELMQKRALDINPKVKVRAINMFFTKENSGEIDFNEYDYIVDAIDTVSAKIELIKKAKQANVPIISSMGTGNKLNPLMFEITDISKTSVCPLARVMRKELKTLGIKGVKVLSSKEEPIVSKGSAETKGTQNRPAPGSCSFVPSVAGLVIASEIIKDLTK